MSKIGFAFDLHGTLTLSNDAWINAYILEFGDNIIRDEVSNLVYRKTSREEIAKIFRLNYSNVIETYHRLLKPDYNMCILARVLSESYPVFLVSSASQEKVERDLQTINMNDVFTNVYHKNNFSKASKKDWEDLISNNNIDVLFFIGNDIDEDICLSPNMCVLLSGVFLNKLKNLGILYNRIKDK